MWDPIKCLLCLSRVNAKALTVAKRLKMVCSLLLWPHFLEDFSCALWSSHTSLLAVPPPLELSTWGSFCLECVCVCVCPHTCSCMISHVWLFATPWAVALHAPLSMEFSMEWVSISCSWGSSLPRDWIHVSCISCIGRWILYHRATWEAWSVHSLQIFIWLASYWEILPNQQEHHTTSSSWHLFILLTVSLRIYLYVCLWPDFLH